MRRLFHRKSYFFLNNWNQKLNILFRQILLNNESSHSLKGVLYRRISRDNN